MDEHAPTKEFNRALEMAALKADAEADRLEANLRGEASGIRLELMAGARAARRIAKAIRSLKIGDRL